MSTTPTRPDENQEVLDDETKRILQERDMTFEEDKKTAEDAREALKEIRQTFKHLQPR